MKRVLLGISILTVSIGVGAYASIHSTIREEIARVERAQHVAISQHVRKAFIAVLADSPHSATLEELLIKRMYGSGVVRLSPEKTIRHRLSETVIERVIRARYDDEALLRTYLDRLYMGQDGKSQIVGLADAAKTLLRKDLSEVTLPEAALLAGIHHSPNVWSPLKHPDRALMRRNLVLRRMMKLGLILQPEYEYAVSTPG